MADPVLVVGCPVGGDGAVLKDFRRVATRYNKLADDFGSAVALASIVESGP